GRARRDRVRAEAERDRVGRSAGRDLARIAGCNFTLNLRIARDDPAVQDSSFDPRVTKMRRPLRPAVLALVALVAPLALMLAPRDGASVIVMAADSRRAAEAVAIAGGAIMTRFGAYGLIAHSDIPGF